MLLQTKRSNRKCHFSHTHYVYQFVSVCVLVRVSVCVRVRVTVGVHKFNAIWAPVSAPLPASKVHLLSKAEVKCLPRQRIHCQQHRIAFVFGLNYGTDFKDYKGLLDSQCSRLIVKEATCQLHCLPLTWTRTLYLIVNLAITMWTAVENPLKTHFNRCHDHPINGQLKHKWASESNKNNSNNNEAS